MLDVGCRSGHRNRRGLPSLVRVGVGCALIALASTWTEAQKLYWTELDGQTISRADRQVSPAVEVLGITSAPLGVALDPSSDAMYWIVRSIGVGSIDGMAYAAMDPLGGDNPEQILVVDETCPRANCGPLAIAVDAGAGYVYWTYHDRLDGAEGPWDRIRRVEPADPNNIDHLVDPNDPDDGMVDLAGIALDIGAGKMFWADHRADRIVRANLDGTDIETLYGPGHGVDRPTGLALDVAREKVYWAETVGRSIKRANLDGSGVVTTLTDLDAEGASAVAVDVVAELVYWADYQLDHIQRMDPEDPGSVESLLEGLHGPWGVALDRAPCSASVDLHEGRWKQLALPCEVASAGVNDVFAGLAGSYETDWVLWSYDPASRGYALVNLDDTLEYTQSYWIQTVHPGQSVEISVGSAIEQDTGQRFVIPLGLHPEGEWNMVGHPFHIPVDWASAKVRHNGMVKTLNEVDPEIGVNRACSFEPVDPSCVMSRVAYRWQGSAYEAFDGETPGVEGTLTPFDGYWVKAFGDPGIDEVVLLVPALPSGGKSLEAKATSGDWAVRLIVESEDVMDAGNVLGQLHTAVDGHDRHDLEELEPFDADYLTLVFPHPEWGRRALYYTTDFRAPSLPGIELVWDLEIHAGRVGRTVTIRWEGPEEVLVASRLLDSSSERLSPPTVVRAAPGASHTFILDRDVRRLQWLTVVPEPTRPTPRLPAGRVAP